MCAHIYRKQRNEGCRITDDFTYKGYRSLMLENEVLLIHLLLDKGSEPIRWLHKPTDTDFIWYSRMGLLPATPLHTDYQMNYLGGWQEMFPEVSETHTYRGATVHRGEAAVTPWDYRIIKDESEEIVVLLTNCIRSMPFRMEKTITLKAGSASVLIEETIYNESALTPLEANWGHHLAFGPPFLDEHTRVDIASTADVYHPQTNEHSKWPAFYQNGNPVDLSYMAEPGTKRDLIYIRPQEGKYQLHSPQKQLGLEVRWNQEVWPYVWYWQNFQEDIHAPFFACEYNIGLEMFNIPPKLTVAEAVEQGLNLKIPPLGSISSWLEIEVVNGR